MRIIRIATKPQGSETPTSLAIVKANGITSHTGFSGHDPHAELVPLLRKYFVFIHFYMLLIPKS